MNYRMAIIAALASFLFAVHCTEEKQEAPKPSYAEKILSGEHGLRKMAERIGTESKTSASFFLIAGNFKSSTSTETLIKFAWKMNDGTYAFSSLPLEKFRVRFEETASVPTVKFRWRSSNCGCPSDRVRQIQELMDDYVLYALLTVRESDWPTQITLPLNEKPQTGEIEK